MKILGMDPSLRNFGWVVLDGDEVLARGRFQTDAKTLFIDRYISLRESVMSLISEHGIRYIGCEYPIFRDLYSEGMYGLFLYTAEAIKLSGGDVVYLSPGQVKAHARLFLGRPSGWKMEKIDMVEAAKKASPSPKWDHNEADAFWVARAAQRFWMFVAGDIQDCDLTRVERQQFADVRTPKRGRDAGKLVQKGILFREDERFFRWHGDDPEKIDAVTGSKNGDS